MNMVFQYFVLQICWPSWSGLNRWTAAWNSIYTRWV